MVKDTYQVLILDDDIPLSELLKEFLQTHTRSTVTCLSREEDFWNCPDLAAFDILFLDYKLGETTGLEVLAKISQKGLNLPTVMMTGEGSENVAVRAIQLGALDYLIKGDYSLNTLPSLIQKAVRLREMQQSMHQYLEQIRFQATLLNNIRDALVVWNLEGKITYWNPAAEQLYAIPAAERLGKSVQEAYFPCFDPPVEFSTDQAAVNIPLEHRYCLAEGQTIWISSHITPLSTEENGVLFGFMDVARDITPRKLEQEELVKSQRFVQRIIDTSPNIIFIFDLALLSIRYINPEVRSILGYDVDDLIGNSVSLFADLIFADDKPLVNAHLNEMRTCQDGQVFEIEYRVRNHAGNFCWLKSRETVFSRNADGTPFEMIGVIQDITANKEAEDRLRRRLNSEKLLASASNQLLNMARQDADTGIRDALMQVANFIQVDFGMIFLLEQNRLIPYRLEHGLTGRLLDRSMPILNLAQLNLPWLLERLHTLELVILHSSSELPQNAIGERQLIERMGVSAAIFVPMIYNHNLCGTVVFGIDHSTFPWNEEYVYMLRTFSEMVTNAILKKQIDQALRKSEARYRAIVEEHQTEMICRFLADATLTFVNEAYCQYYEQDRRQLIGSSFLTPILEGERDVIRALVSDLSANHPIKNFEQRILNNAGEVRWQEWTSRAIFDQHNDFIEFQAVGRDITARKKMEEQLKTAQTHLAQAARLASIGELASGVAHQISNPLTTIIGDAQILLHQLDRRHPGRESAEAIVQAGWRTQQVINELIKFSDAPQNSHAAVSVNDTIEKSLLLASVHLQAYGIKIVVDTDPSLPTITANAHQLTDLWLNLLLLARSAAQDGKNNTIHIRTQKVEEHGVQVTVTDDGKPILPAQFDKIFEPQLLPTGEGRGTGMELSLCREIARQNQGEISIQGNGKETTFVIVFMNEQTTESNE